MFRQLIYDHAALRANRDAEETPRMEMALTASSNSIRNLRNELLHHEADHRAKRKLRLDSVALIAFQS
jgi:hypothetical protein